MDTIPEKLVHGILNAVGLYKYPENVIGVAVNTEINSNQPKPSV